MKCSLGISNFLEEISSLSHSVVFLYFFALFSEEGFLISSCYFLELCIQMGIWTKLVEVMEFHLSYFKFWKMMLWKCCTQHASKFGKLSSGRRTGKGQFSFQSQRKVMPKNAQTTTQLHSYASKVMLKILQARLQQYMNRHLPQCSLQHRLQ